MSLLVRHSERFEIDLRRQADWYLDQGAFTAARDFAKAVESTLTLLATQPFLGPECNYPDPELAGLRIFLVVRPFQRFLIFYRVTMAELQAFRVVEGHRDLPRRLVDPPGAE